MNRPIKFRAWDGVNMHYDVSPFQWDYNISRTHWYCEGYYPDGHPIFSRIEGIPGELMQFIGRLDKNGKEIFEGDIVKTDDNVNWEVLWNTHSVAFDMRAKYPKEMWMSPWLPEDEYEVIGDIFTTPELMGGANEL